jgi:uncharacterized Zn-finger protein
VKTHVCGECGQSYADKKRLKDHILMHEGVKPFSCQFCKQKFRRNDQLKNHLRRKHAADAQADAKKIIYL